VTTPTKLQVAMKGPGGHTYSATKHPEGWVYSINGERLTTLNPTQCHEVTDAKELAAWRTVAEMIARVEGQENERPHPTSASETARRKEWLP
jgi:hypothetical protein